MSQRADSHVLRALDAADAANSTKYAELERVFTRSETLGYDQSHPYDQVFRPGAPTGAGLAEDEWRTNGNYMRMIFGGAEPPAADNITRAYALASGAALEAPTVKHTALGELRPADFVPGARADKDSLLQTFAACRQQGGGHVDSDAERFLKSRPTHNMVHTTFYGREAAPGTNAPLRFHHIVGQSAHVQFRPDTSRLRPTQDLSSKTFAPMENGRAVPLRAELVYGDDPRAISVEAYGSKVSALGAESVKDLGPYFGAPPFEGAPGQRPGAGLARLFAEDLQRKYMMAR